MVRPDRAGVNLDGQDVCAAPGEHLKVGQNTRADPVGNEIRQALLQGKRIGDPPDMPGPVFDTDEKYSTRGVRERDHGLNHCPPAGNAPAIWLAAAL
jgi:hypothetical protein